jgi:hypothetical protein
MAGSRTPLQGFEAKQGFESKHDMQRKYRDCERSSVLPSCGAHLSLSAKRWAEQVLEKELYTGSDNPSDQ